MAVEELIQVNCSVRRRNHLGSSLFVSFEWNEQG